MIQISETEVFGWRAAIRGMRNPHESWDKSDTVFDTERYTGVCWTYTIGEADLALMKKLSKAGDDHSKFLRMINVTMDITAPLYWWKEFDTYKIGTVSNSCSTMHRIHAKMFELEDFSHDNLNVHGTHSLEGVIIALNRCRRAYLHTKDKEHWWQMIQLLPSSYNQKRTIQLNYQVLKTMYHARKNHKLDEWREFCKWCESLPYFKEICIEI